MTTYEFYRIPLRWPGLSKTSSIFSFSLLCFVYLFVCFSLSFCLFFSFLLLLLLNTHNWRKHHLSISFDLIQLPVLKIIHIAEEEIVIRSWQRRWRKRNRREQPNQQEKKREILLVFLIIFSLTLDCIWCWCKRDIFLLNWISRIRSVFIMQ